MSRINSHYLRKLHLEISIMKVSLFQQFTLCGIRLTDPVYSKGLVLILTILPVYESVYETNAFISF